MSDEKPIFKCVKSKDGSDNNWWYPEYIDISKDYTEEQQLKADIMRRSIAVMEEIKKSKEAQDD